MAQRINWVEIGNHCLITPLGKNLLCCWNCYHSHHSAASPCRDCLSCRERPHPRSHAPRVTFTQRPIKPYFILMRDTSDGAVRLAWLFPLPNPPSINVSTLNTSLSQGLLSRELILWHHHLLPQYNLTCSDWYNKCTFSSAVS